MRAELVFDDGGMNLLSSSALVRLRESLPGDDVSLFVFRSGRPHIFAAGADMAEMQRFGAYDAEAFARLGQELFEAIEQLPCVTVVVIDGAGDGGAHDLALSFDFRFATPRSRFAHPGARLGIVTGFGGTSRWRKVLSRRAANQMFLANRVASADEALAMGLVDRVAESHDEDLQRLESLDARMVKDLARHARNLSRRERVSHAARLARIYGY
jgi:enoyl-CoA hydratase